MLLLGTFFATNGYKNSALYDFSASGRRCPETLPSVYKASAMVIGFMFDDTLVVCIEWYCFGYGKQSKATKWTYIGMSQTHFLGYAQGMVINSTTAFLAAGYGDNRQTTFLSLDGTVTAGPIFPR